MIKIRTVYFKVENMRAARDFWSGFLGFAPHKRDEEWTEFMLENIRLGFLLQEPDDVFQGSSGTIVFEYPESEFLEVLSRARALGAAVASDHINDPDLRCVVLADPNGHEFEISIKGTHH